VAGGAAAAAAEAGEKDREGERSRRRHGHFEMLKRPAVFEFDMGLILKNMG
jgi:hypothetical protein